MLQFAVDLDFASIRHTTSKKELLISVKSFQQIFAEIS